jgi:hypothetical protein
MAAIDPTLFRATLADEMRAAWRALNATHAKERFYSFGLYTAPCAEYLMVTAGTEEGLARATDEYLAKYGGDPALRRASLRWSFADSPLHAEGEALLPRSSALRDAGPDPYEGSAESDAAIALVFAAAADALRAMDGDGLFGSGTERSAIILGIWWGDQSDEDRVELATPLNPPDVTARFARELEQADAAFLALSASSALS